MMSGMAVDDGGRQHRGYAARHHRRRGPPFVGRAITLEKGVKFRRGQCPPPPSCRDAMQLPIHYYHFRHCNYHWTIEYFRTNHFSLKASGAR